MDNQKDRNFWNCQSYHEFLRSELDSRSIRNQRYSLRAFARDTSLHPSTLSQILNGKARLSVGRARGVARALKFDKDKTSFFLNLVQMEASKNATQRQLAERKLAGFRTRREYSLLRLDYFKTVEDWYYLAIRTLATSKTFQAEPVWISKFFGISPGIARDALDRLARLGLLIKKHGRIQAASGLIRVGEKIPSFAIQKFHSELLTKAKDALKTQSIDERYFSSNMLTIDKSDLPAASAAIEQFCLSFVKEFSQRADGNRIYAMNVQLFNLAAHDAKEMIV